MNYKKNKYNQIIKVINELKSVVDDKKIEAIKSGMEDALNGEDRKTNMPEYNLGYGLVEKKNPKLKALPALRIDNSNFQKLTSIAQSKNMLLSELRRQIISDYVAKTFESKVE